MNEMGYLLAEIEKYLPKTVSPLTKSKRRKMLI